MLFAWGTGTGKTYGALALAKKSKATTLIVCPKRVLKKWVNQATEWLPQEHLVITKETFRRDYTIIGKYESIIIDEAHLGFGNYKSLLHKALVAYIKAYGVTNIWLLTGTPYTSTPWSVYSLGKILGAPWKWMEFRNKYFRERYLGQRVIWEPREGIESEIAEVVESIGNVVRLDTCVDMPEQTDVFETMKQSREQKKAQKAVLERETNPLVRFGKYHQIAQGIEIGNEFTASAVYEAEKNATILELASANDKLAVFTRYTKHIDLLKELLESKKIPVFIIRGDTKDPEEVMRLAEESKRCVVLINSECAEGYELPSFSVIVFASLSYSFVKYEQARGRFLRINAMKPNLYIHLFTEGGADQAVWESIKKKQNFSEAIYAQENVI